MDVLSRLALTLIVGHLGGALVATRAAEPAPARRNAVRVVGEGHATAAPDVAVAFLGVEALAPDLSAATADANDRMRRVLEALSAQGIAKKDVQTTRYDVAIDRSPQSRGGPASASGYRVASEVRVTVRDVAKVGRVIDAAVKAGANASRGLAFRKEDTSLERNRALSSAIADARGKAEALAKAAGRVVGEVLEISEDGGARPLPVEGFRSMAATADTAAEPGELQISARVEVVFALK